MHTLAIHTAQHCALAPVDAAAHIVLKTQIVIRLFTLYGGNALQRESAHLIFELVVPVTSLLNSGYLGKSISVEPSKEKKNLNSNDGFVYLDAENGSTVLHNAGRDVTPTKTKSSYTT